MDICGAQFEKQYELFQHKKLKKEENKHCVDGFQKDVRCTSPGCFLLEVKQGNAGVSHMIQWRIFTSSQIYTRSMNLILWFEALTLSVKDEQWIMFLSFFSFLFFDTLDENRLPLPVWLYLTTSIQLFDSRIKKHITSLFEKCHYKICKGGTSNMIPTSRKWLA